MALTSATVHLALLYLSVAIAAGVAVFAYRNRDVPGAKPFTVLVVSIALWSLTHAISLQTPDPGTRVLWFYAGWLPMAWLHVWLLLFALTYTGYDRFVTRRSLAALSVVPTVTVLGMWTNRWHRLMWTSVETYVVNGLVLQDFSWSVLYWVQIVWSYAIIVVAAVLFLRLIVASDYLYFDQAALLLVGILTPLLVNAADVLQFAQGPTLDYTTVAFTVTGTSFGYALFRRRLFDLVPATRHLGRSEAVGQLDAGIIVIDTGDTVVYCNEAAAEVLDCAPSDALDRDLRSLVEEDAVDFGVESGLAEIERADRVYEVRTSPVTDRHDREIGHVLVVHDVTVRKRRERRLAEQRDELALVNDLNRVIRGINQALVSASTREEIERALCERVIDADVYRAAAVADVPTWTGDADRWRVASDADDASPPTGLEIETLSSDGIARPTEAPPTVDEEPGTWAVVPLAYGRTVYGALALFTERPEISDREQSVLGELGETVGYAIHAVETERLLAADAIVELEIESDDAADPIVAATASAGHELSVTGVVPRQEAGHVAYVRVGGGDADVVAERLATASPGNVRVVRRSDAGGLLEWQVTGESLLGGLSALGANVRSVRAVDGRARYEVEVASDADARSLLDHLGEPLPAARMVAKRRRSGSVEPTEELPEERLDELTDRQREVLKAAVESGYFEWPRDSTAEEVAEDLGISSPTFHEHLRAVQETLIVDVFDRDPVD